MERKIVSFKPGTMKLQMCHSLFRDFELMIIFVYNVHIIGANLPAAALNQSFGKH